MAVASFARRRLPLVEHKTIVQIRIDLMTRMERQTLERELEQTRRLALEPTDPLTRERLAEMIEQLEFQLQEKFLITV